MHPVIVGSVKSRGWPASNKRDRRLTIREGIRGTAKTWARQMLPRHFHSGASRRYTYARRSPGYVRQKKRTYGHERSLVLTGASEKAARVSRTVSASSTKGSIRLGALPWYFTRVMRPSKKTGVRIDKMAELGRVSRRETQALAAVLRDLVVRMYRHMAKVKKRRA